MPTAKQLLQLQNQIKRDRYITDRATPTSSEIQAGIFVGIDSTRNAGVVRLPSGKTIDCRVLTNGTIVPGSRVLVKSSGGMAFITGVPR